MLATSPHKDSIAEESARPHDLPDGWATATLGEACLVNQGQSPPGKTYNNDGMGLPFLQGKAEFGTTYPIATKWCSAPSKIAEPGDVLISIRAPVGPTNLCAVQSCIGRGLAAIRSQGDMPPKYVLFAMRATEEELRANATGTTFEAIRGDDLRSHPISLPPLAEQHRIVAEIEKQFTRLDASVASLRRVQANLKRYRASVLKAAHEGRLVPIEAELARAEGRDYEHASVLLERILAEHRARWESQPKRRGKYKEPLGPDTSGLPELPEGWTWATAAQLGEVRLGRQRSPKRATGPHMRPYLRAANVTWDGLDLSDVKEMDFSPREYEIYRLRRGDILLAEASGSADEVGKPAMWADQIAGCCFQNTLIRVRAFPTIVPYLFCHLLSDARTGALGRAARGVGIHHLGAQRTESWAVALPPLAEQDRIVAEVDHRLSVIQQAEATIEANLTRAKRLRQSILKRAFSGKLVPQDPYDEPASVLLERIRAEREEAEAAARVNGRLRRGRSKKSSGRQHTRSEAAT